MITVKKNQTMGTTPLYFATGQPVGVKFPYNGPYDIGYMLKSFTQDGVNVTATISKYGSTSLVGAQTLLAAPVTKTPTNTMKIQYNFQIQKVL